MRKALYPGTFDPITLGHVDIVHRGLQIFDAIEIAVAVNIKKQPTFTDTERLQMIKETFHGETRVTVSAFQGLLVDYARKSNIRTVLRGLRAMSDFEYEFQLASMNRKLTAEVDFAFLMTSEEHFFVSSSLVKDVAINGGDISGLVPQTVIDMYARRTN